MSIWADRAKQYGRRSAVGLPVPEHDLDRVTTEQFGVLLPLLEKELVERPARALDFGCGYGRFSPALCLLADRVTAFDPCPDLFGFAPECAAEFHSGEALQFLSLHPGTFDLIWVVHVLGGIHDEVLPDYADALADALAPGGLLFVSDNTDQRTSSNGFWTIRPEWAYKSVFLHQGVILRVVGHYAALGNPMSVFAGRKE